MRGIYIPLSCDEIEALAKMAECKKRDTRQQGALLIRQSLEQLGWLKPQPLPNEMEDAQHEQSK